MATATSDVCFIITAELAAYLRIDRTTDQIFISTAKFSSSVDLLACKLIRDWYMELQYLNISKPVPLQAWSGPEGSRKLRFPHFMTTAQECGKVVSLTHRPHLPPGNSPGDHFCYRLSQPQGRSAIGRIMSMKNSNGTIWNRTSDLTICSTAP